jgi:hypothetical protein
MTLQEIPISALRFIPQSLRRTGSTPRSAGIVRLELGLFAKSSIQMIFGVVFTKEARRWH